MKDISVRRFIFREYNDNHDELGRFANGAGFTSTSVTKEKDGTYSWKAEHPDPSKKW